MKVAVLVSGGIDSLMSAVLLKREHSPVLGLHLRMGYNDLSGDQINTISDRAGIPVEVIDCRREFTAAIVDYFVAAYLRGETPNPCLRCNPLIKFGLGLDYALRQGADLLASGHYCTLRRESDGLRLAGGVDRRKDQSYFLAFLKPEQLARLCFPVGAMTKAEVVARAGELGLAPVVTKESQDVCFIGKGETYADFIQRRVDLPPRPGEIENLAGEVIGRHGGVHLFTVGQRRGINCPAGRPYYVAAIDWERNCIRVGHREELMASGCRVREVNWIIPPPGGDISCLVKIRYQHRPVPARVAPLTDGDVGITFAEPQFGIAPGQGAVFYREDMVLGGGIISGQAP